MELTEDQIFRYSRNIILNEVGGEGQKKLLSSKVLIIGAGGLGSPAALYLSAAGVGMLGIIDADAVDLTNLQRQIIHFTQDVKKQKVDSAEEKINQLNPDVTVRKYPERATKDNIAKLIKEYDFVIDGTDNFTSKFLINDACVLGKKPFSHAGILRFSGQTITHVPGHACYRCLFDSPPPKGVVPSCSQAGIIGSLAGILGSIQATETIKFIIGKGDLLVDRLLVFDSLTMNVRTVRVKKNPQCPVCGENPSITELREYEQPVCDLRQSREGIQK